MNDRGPGQGGADGADAADALGVVAGRFELGELLGAGGTSSVFEAVDRETGASVALKLLHAHLSDSPERLDAFFTEARALTRVRHPGVVSVTAFGVHDAGGLDQAWIAVDLVHGQTLADRVRAGGPLPAGDALVVAIAVLGALGAVHAAGVVHRDISPANVMIAGEAGSSIVAGDVRLVDFGLADETGRAAVGTDALLTGDASDDLGAVASVHFAAPEQVRGGRVTEQSDLYAVAAMLYFALTGHPPFPRAHAADVARAHAAAPPPVPSAVVPGLPRSIDRALVRGMAKVPARRFADATEMAAALTAALAALPAPGLSAEDWHPTSRLPGTVVVPQTLGVPHTLVPANAGGADAPTTRLEQHVTDRPRSPAGTPSSVAAGSAHSSRSSPGSARQRPSRARGPLIALVGIAVIAAGMVFWSWAALARGPEPVAAAPSSTAALVPETIAPAIEPEREGLEVPDVAGRSLADARVIIERAGLRVGAVMSELSERPLDTMLRTEPAMGDWVLPGTAIGLVVASGSNAVPGVGGHSVETATATLSAAGFTAVVEHRIDATAVPGAALGTRPATGSVLPLGASVTLIVAESAPIVATPTPTPTPLPSPSPTPTPPSGPGDHAG